MYLTTYHCHSRLSPDGSAPLSAMADAAIAAGLSELCITDHYDTVTQDGAVAPLCNWPPMLAQFLETRDAYRGRIVLKLGLEFGSAYRSDAAITSAPAELDFVIGSLHNLSAARGGGDLYYGPYRTPEDCYANLDDYVAQLEVLAPLHSYDVLGHIIYPMRYMRERDGQPVSMRPYYARIEALLRVAAQQGRGMEINTFNGHTVAEWRDVLQMYHAVGGEILTIGDDAHQTRNVGRGIREAHALARDVGFRYLCTYTHRVPQFVKL